jgi:hypothetical protein
LLTAVPSAVPNEPESSYINFWEHKISQQIKEIHAIHAHQSSLGAVGASTGNGKMLGDGRKEHAWCDLLNGDIYKEGSLRPFSFSILNIEITFISSIYKRV